MQFTPIVSAREVSTRLDPLQNQLQRIYDNQGIELYEESKGNVKIEDVRAATLMTCKADIINNIMILNLLASVKEGKIHEKTWRALIGLADDTIQLEFLERNLSQYLRLSLSLSLSLL
ncbi:hypothetical protein NTE_02103 [Candidatus Nitrososphaera evergladensis SR1]|uniref:Uncharacterized protein n=1 Tax=Candidatus Nitrososphaera evergladensis SR1 TaxID=1459636 RepID=A0A075MSM6_9ARCH|nr:hypothetical protein [Candidatus Nitrososphaera evergladensis]AIF84158.1 hypothetical protein NTE_02103 [Candidatus Nitrososphaera evergladensis SR1]